MSGLKGADLKSTGRSSKPRISGHHLDSQKHTVAEGPGECGLTRAVWAFWWLHGVRR